MTKVDGGSAFPNLDFRQVDDVSAGSTVGGMSLRDYFAARAMQAFCSVVVGDDTYSPALTDEDFKESEEGKWYKTEDKKGWWCCANVTREVMEGKYGKPHSMVTTYEQRLARDAYKQVDAMIAERKRSLAQTPSS